MVQRSPSLQAVQSSERSPSWESVVQPWVLQCRQWAGRSLPSCYFLWRLKTELPSSRGRGGGVVPALKVRNELLSLSEVNLLWLLQHLVNWSYQGLWSLGMEQSLDALPAQNHCSKTYRDLCPLICNVKSFWKAHA